MIRNVFKRAGALVLVSAMAVALIPKIEGDSLVLADGFVKTVDNTYLCTGKISNPLVPTDKIVSWAGSYVYFGNYSNKPIRFRVLNPKETKFGTDTLFLDSDKLLFEERFDEAPYSNAWADSTIRKSLNEDFYNNSFSKSEQAVIWSNKIESHDYSSDIVPLPSDVITEYKKYTPLTGEKVFLLDVEDALNTKYGYYTEAGHNGLNQSNHRKAIADTNSTAQPHWWLRSPLARTSNSVAFINQYGSLVTSTIGDPSPDPTLNTTIFASPALNLDRNKILFSSLISGEAGEAEAEYKLTIEDDDIQLALPEGQAAKFENGSWTVPYVLSGKKAGEVTQFSVMVLSKDYRGGDLGDPDLMYYKKIDAIPAANGTVTFTLPSQYLSQIMWGCAYQLYLVAEDVNGIMETDYSSKPLLLENPRVEYDVRTPLEINLYNYALLSLLAYGEAIGYNKDSEYPLFDIDKNGVYDLALTIDEANNAYLSKLDDCLMRGRCSFAQKPESALVGDFHIQDVSFVFSDYKITLNDITHGSATLSKTEAQAGDEVAVTVKPESGYELDKITYKVGGVATDITDSKKFTMPEDDVTVDVVFKKSATPTVAPTVAPTASATPTATTKPAAPTATVKPTVTSTPKHTKPSALSLSIDKSSANVVCGKPLTLKATLKGSKDKVTWKSSDTKVATVDKNGKVTAKMAGTVTITASAAGKTATCTVTVLYKDVTNTKDFWYAPTNYLTAKGVVKGYDKQTKFKPANECTRAQMVTFIWRLMGEPKPKTSKCKFSDVKKTDYFYKACIWGNENHIVEGYKDGTFGPQIVCARKHAVTFLWRLAGQPAPKTKTNKFMDVKKSDYFYKATLWASETNILAGYSDGTFRPNGDCLRRQMVTFLYKYDKFINGKG